MRNGKDYPISTMKAFLVVLSNPMSNLPLALRETQAMAEEVANRIELDHRMVIDALRIFGKPANEYESVAIWQFDSFGRLERAYRYKALE